MRPLVAVLAAMVLTAFAVAGLMLRPEPPAQQPAPAMQAPARAAAEDVATETGGGAPKADRLPVPARVRAVAPDIVAQPRLDVDALERVEARLPLSSPAELTVQREARPRMTLLHRPHAIAGGMFHAQGHTVRLAGIEPADDRETCISDGVSWPCGVHARTAFRNWLRGRALSCVVPETAGRETVVADCVLGRQNPAEWLVRYGWARALPDGPYGELERQARTEGLGLHGRAPAVPATSGSGG